jgi:diguanylate cyclase (GGDEF)-like protein
MSEPSLCDFFGVDEAEIAERRAFLGLSGADDANLAVLRDVLRDEIEAIMDEFYAHVKQFKEPSAFFADAKILARLRQAQENSLRELGQGATERPYFEKRLRIGLAHERIGLAQKWYLGGYATLFEAIGRRLLERCDGQPETVFSLLATLHKAFLQDTILAVETYHKAATGRLEHVLNELNETQKHLQALSRLDELTGISSRKHVLDSLKTEVYRSRRFSHPLAVLLFDVDHFKRINDTYGHVYGDYTLRRLVNVVREVIRPVDLFGRYGGEEFILGLVECELEPAELSAERLRSAVEQARFDHDGHRTNVTVSVGIAMLQAEDASLTDVIKRADKALYRAKASGRNQVAVEGEDPQA